jgi:hypothetical protein
MTVPFDPTIAKIIARDRAEALRRDWPAPLHTSSEWRTGTLTQSEPAQGTPTEQPASRTIPTPVSDNSRAWAMPLRPPASQR